MKSLLNILLPVLLLFALALSACAGTLTQEPALTTAASTATEPAPTVTQEEQPAEATPEAPSTGENPGTYKIIPGESKVSYEVGETFLNQNNRFAVAIGVTTQINGEIRIDAANPQNSSLGIFTVDISQFKSDSSRRDNAIRERFIQTAQYPIVTFVPTQLEGLPGSYNEGEQISFKVTGDVTIRETTRPLTFDVTARLNGDTLSGIATTTFLMSDFAFGPISIAGILNTEDQVKITIEFVARPG